MWVFGILAIAMSFVLFVYVGVKIFGVFQMFENNKELTRQELFRQSGTTFLTVGLMLIIWSAFLHIILAYIQ